MAGPFAVAARSGRYLRSNAVLVFAVLMTEQQAAEVTAPVAEKYPALSFILPDLHSGHLIRRTSFHPTGQRILVFVGCVRPQMSEGTTVRDLVDAAAVWSGLNWKNRTMTKLEAVVLTRPQHPAADVSCHADMIWIPGGTFNMGSDRHYADEAPVHCVTVGPFLADIAPVSNHEFHRSVAEVGYVTFAEIPPNPNDYPGAA
jgi:formylglycine-generating enzyme required for sulfatase activity